MKHTIRAVVFDMDGVLIDSEIVYLRHTLDALRPRYPQLKEEDLYPTVGMSGGEYRPFMAGLLGYSTDDPAFQRELAEMNAACKIDYRAILRPRVPELLKKLREMGLQLALASSSSPDNIRQVLRECGITDYFDCIVSGDEFARSKPDPEIYHYTFAKLGRRPEECLVVEDSTYGVTAGVASGAVVAALRDGRFPFDQSAAQLHIDRLDELPALAACGGRRIRAAFFDIDGTLACIGSHMIPDSARAALRALRERGVATVISTGRHALEIEEENLLSGLEFDGAVYMNGQLCELHGEPVFRCVIPAEDLRGLDEFLRRTGCSCILLERDAMYCNKVDRRMEEEQARIGTAVPPVRPFDGLEDREVYQVIPFVNADEEAALLAMMPHCKSMRWGAGVIDINFSRGGKAAGVQAVCAALGISTQDCIAFGDAENDVEMLCAAGIGVAMGNALGCVKRAADYVTDSVEGDGIMHALQHFCLL